MSSVVDGDFRVLLGRQKLLQLAMIFCPLQALGTKVAFDHGLVFIFRVVYHGLSNDRLIGLIALIGLIGLNRLIGLIIGLLVCFDLFCLFCFGLWFGLVVFVLFDCFFVLFHCCCSCCV